MQNPSFIYRNLFIYRMIMNLLYSGSYKQRFKRMEILIDQYRPSTVLELCFGDTHIAEYCENNGIQWEGVDINNSFVRSAVRKGYKVWQGDLICVNHLPKADVCVMSGSLYHFHKHIHHILELIFSSARYFFISEPVKNISGKKGIIGTIAHVLSNAGKGKESFRYDEASLKQMLEQESKIVGFKYEVAGHFKKDILIVIQKNETPD